MQQHLYLRFFLLFAISATEMNLEIYIVDRFDILALVVALE